MDLTAERLTVADGADLAGSGVNPVPYNKRTVGGRTLTAIWFGMAVQLAIFIAAGQMYPALTGWQILIALVVAYTVVAVIMWLTQDIGIKFGIPFAVSVRPSFGYLGVHLPAYLRAVPAMFWFGFQTWLGAAAFGEITQMLFGWNNLMLLIVIFGLIQIALTYFGIRAIAWFNWFVSPVLLVIGVYMLMLLLNSANTTFGEVMASGGEGGFAFPLAVMALIGGWATLAVSIQDITKECKVTNQEATSWWASNKRFIAAQWFGMVPASVLFGTIGMVSVAVAGDWNPVTVISKVIGETSPAIAIMCLLFIVLATWSTNGAANLLPPAYVISNTWPSKITYGMGVIIAGIIGLAMQPWQAAPNLLSFLGVIAYGLAPVAGILLCDYFILRRRQLDINALYSSKGQYRYWNGLNPAAFLAYAIGIVVSIPLWDYLYFVGMIVAAIAYWLLMKYWIVKVYPQPEIK